MLSTQTARRLLLLLMFCAAGQVLAAEPIERPAALPEATPWNLEALSEPPAFGWVDQSGNVHSLTYAGPEYQGRLTRVFAYYATPDTLAGQPPGDRKFPAVVLIHGGGGTAFREWAELWAKRGYAAIAMDLAGHRPVEGENAHQLENRTRLEDGGPNQTDAEKFAAIDQPVTEHWPYHAVANAILAHSLVRSFAEVDRSRTAVTGISWGGYLTCLVASLDNRFSAAAPVYGCGFLHENSAWRDAALKRLPEESRKRWVQLYDPSRYLPACRVPIFFVNGTNDFAYPLDSYMKSYAAVPGEKNIRITVNMPHSHPAGWAPDEIAAFFDSQLRDAPGLPKIATAQLEGGQATAEVVSPLKLKAAALHYTTGTGPINGREWTTNSAMLTAARISVAAPPKGTTAWFFTVTDERGLTVSSGVGFPDK